MFRLDSFSQMAFIWERSVYTQYLDGGRFRMTHRVDQDGYEEMIHVTQLDDRSCHIVRTV